jgi:hypothetical protein
MQGSARRYLLGLLVYAGAALLLVCLAVFAGSFSQTFGAARVSGRFSPFPLFNRSRLEALTLSWNGITLSFSRGSNPGLLMMETGAGTADIVFGDKERLRLSAPDAHGSALTLSRVPDGAQAGDALRIPFRISGILQAGAGANAISWKRGAGSFQLALPSEASVDYSTRVIRLAPSVNGSSADIRFVSLSPEAAHEAEPAASRPQAPRLPGEQSLPTMDQLAASISRWSDAAYAGWSSGRYAPGSRTWKMPDGRQGFAEEIGTGLLAEALARGSFAAALQTWTGALNNQLAGDAAARLRFPNCVYTGRVRDFAARSGNPAELARLKSLADQGDPSLAATPGVLVAALDRGGPSLARSVLSSLRSLDQAKLPASQLLTVLESLEDYARYLGDDAGVLSDARALVTGHLLPSLVASSEGSIFLAQQDGNVDVRQSLRCGVLLLRAGSLLPSPQFSAFGRGLIASSLSLAADSGFLPAGISVVSGRVTPQDGMIAPETVYAMLPVERYVPHEVPLFQRMGAACWVWTAANLVSAAEVNGEVRLIFAFPGGVAQYLVFQGIRPFQQIRLHGIPWHSDPSYAKYSDGWDYNPDTKTLFMKITGKQDKEELDFTF